MCIYETDIIENCNAQYVIWLCNHPVAKWDSMFNLRISREKFTDLFYKIV